MPALATWGKNGMVANRAEVIPDEVTPAAGYRYRSSEGERQWV